MPFGALLPKENRFYDFFLQHASKCVEGARLLLQLLKNVQDAEALAKEIKEVEHAGDKITHHTHERHRRPPRHRATLACATDCAGPDLCGAGLRFYQRLSRCSELHCHG